MSPVASLVTTDRCSNVSMCLLVSTKCFFPVLFHFCILLEIKLTTINKEYSRRTWWKSGLIISHLSNEAVDCLPLGWPDDLSGQYRRTFNYVGASISSVSQQREKYVFMLWEFAFICNTFNTIMNPNHFLFLTWTFPGKLYHNHVSWFVI